MNVLSQYACIDLNVCSSNVFTKFLNNSYVRGTLSAKRSQCLSLFNDSYGTPVIIFELKKDVRSFLYASADIGLAWVDIF